MIASLATTAPTQFLDVGGTRFAYRRFGSPAGTPLVFTQHFMGNLDNFDPAIANALAPGREIILFDNAGVGRSTGSAPGTIADMAADAASSRRRRRARPRAAPTSPASRRAPPTETSPSATRPSPHTVPPRGGRPQRPRTTSAT